MKKINDKKRLDLRREQLRLLDQRDLIAVVGGYEPPTRQGGYCQTGTGQQ